MWQRQDVSIGVASSAGVVTPVIRNAESLSVGQLEQTIALLGKKASTNTLAIEDMVGATFAINNSGTREREKEKEKRERKRERRLPHAF